MKQFAAAMLVSTLLLATAHAQETPSIEALKGQSAKGDLKATRTLAEAYFTGSGGVPQDFSLAAHYFETLSNRGDTSAQTTLGLMHARGYGVPKNVKEAMKKWQSAASHSHRPDAGAAYNMAVTYLRGEDDVSANSGAALYWMTRAAEAGHVLAQADLGVMYIEGEGTARNELVGTTWLFIAAGQGDTGAQEKIKMYAERLSPDTLASARSLANEQLQRNAARR